MKNSRYFTEGQADGRYVNITGDTMSSGAIIGLNGGSTYSVGGSENRHSGFFDTVDLEEEQSPGIRMGSSAKNYAATVRRNSRIAVSQRIRRRAGLPLFDCFLPLIEGCLQPGVIHGRIGQVVRQSRFLVEPGHRRSGRFDIRIHDVDGNNPVTFFNKVLLDGRANTAGPAC